MLATVWLLAPDDLPTMLSVLLPKNRFELLLMTFVGVVRLAKLRVKVPALIVVDPV